MSTPNEIRKQVLDELIAARREMSTAAWHLHLQEQPSEIRRRAAETEKDMALAILTLERAEIADICDKLVAHETDLQMEIHTLNAALREFRTNLTTAESSIRVARSVLGTLAEVVEFPPSQLKMSK